MKKYSYEFEKGKGARKSNTSTVKNAVSDLLDFYKLKGKFNQMSTMDAWKQVMGESVARRTSKLFMREKTMFIKVESASLKNELMMVKSRIIQELNQVTGEGIVEELIFI